MWPLSTGVPATPAGERCGCDTHRASLLEDEEGWRLGVGAMAGGCTLPVTDARRRQLMELVEHVTVII